MSWLRKFLLQVQTAWSIFGVSLLLLLIGEALLQRYLIRRDLRLLVDAVGDYPDPDHGWLDRYLHEYVEVTIWHPYIYWRKPPDWAETQKVDNNGLRLTWNARHPAGEKFARVFAFGGSTTWGAMARAEFTMPSWLSRHLDAAGQKVEVTSFAQPGYVSTQELIALYLELRKGNVPDVAVFYDGFNEVWSAYQAKQGGIPLNEMNRAAEFRADATRSALQKLVTFFPGFLRVTKGIAFRLAKPYSVGKDAARIQAETLSSYRENVRVAEALGREYGFETLFYWQPILFYKDTLAPNEKKHLVTWGDLPHDFMVEAYEVVKKDARLTGDPRFHDLSELFRRTELAVYADFAHLSEKGNSLVATPIAKDVQAVLAKRSEPRVNLHAP